MKKTYVVKKRILIFILCNITYTFFGMNKKEQENHRYKGMLNRNNALTIYEKAKQLAPLNTLKMPMSFLPPEEKQENTSFEVFVTTVKDVGAYTFANNMVIVNHKVKPKPWIFCVQVYILDQGIQDQERPLFKKPLQSIHRPIYKNNRIMITSKKNEKNKHKTIRLYNIKNPTKKPIKLKCQNQARPYDFRFIHDNFVLISFKNPFRKTNQLYDLTDKAPIFKDFFSDKEAQTTLHNNDTLAVNHYKNIIQIYDTIQQKVLFFKKSSKEIRKYTFSQSFQHLILEYKVPVYCQPYNQTLPKSQFKVYDLQQPKNCVITCNLNLYETCKEHKFGPNEQFLIFATSSPCEKSIKGYNLKQQSKLFDHSWENNTKKYPYNFLDSFHLLESDLLVFICALHSSSHGKYSRQDNQYYNERPQDLEFIFYNLNKKRPKPQKFPYDKCRYLIDKKNLIIKGKNNQERHINMIHAIKPDNNDNEINIFEQKIIKRDNKKRKAKKHICVI